MYLFRVVGCHLDYECLSHRQTYPDAGAAHAHAIFHHTKSVVKGS
jgi:hypothetical protein